MNKGLVFLAIVSVLLLVMLMACSGGSDSGNNDPQPQNVVLNITVTDTNGAFLPDATLKVISGPNEYAPGVGTFSGTYTQGSRVDIEVNGTNATPNYSSSTYVGIPLNDNTNLVIKLMNEDTLSTVAIDDNMAELIKAAVGIYNGNMYKRTSNFTKYKVYDPKNQLPDLAGNENTPGWQSISKMLANLNQGTNGIIPGVSLDQIEVIKSSYQGVPQENTFIYIITDGAATAGAIVRNNEISGVIVEAPWLEQNQMTSEMFRAIFAGSSSHNFDAASNYITAGHRENLVPGDEAFLDHMMHELQKSGYTKYTANGRDVYSTITYGTSANLSNTRDKSSKKKSSTPKIPNRIRKQNRPKTPLKQK